jgi:hypothetical protein
MPDRTREILEDLEVVRENLLALSDEIWLSIDHNDPEALEEGVQFKRAYNEKMASFDALASDLSSMIQQFTSVRLEEHEESGEDDEVRNERIIRALDRETPHSIDEDFEYMRPYGFILDGRGTSGVTTWNRIFALICHELYRREPGRFHAILERPENVRKRGCLLFSSDPARLRKALKIAVGLYAEVNHSANGLRDVICMLLAVFEIPNERLQLLLREDRDAGTDGASRDARPSRTRV